jgi:AraC family transcriptional regulator, positive regulator of tynA and feaB
MTAEVQAAGVQRVPPTLRCWSTEDVQPRDALAYWCDSICQVMLELDIESTGADFFSAQLDQGSLGPATANFLRATAQSVLRTRRRISHSSSAAFLLVHLREGDFRLEHRGQSAHLYSGDCVLVDSGEPYEVLCPRSTACLVLQLPPQWLSAWLPRPEALAGRALRPDTGWSGALSAALSALQPAELGRLALPAGVVAEQIASLLALAAGPLPTDSLRPDVLPPQRLQRLLRDRYHEIGLTPASLAQDLGISARYLHYLFAKQATTFGHELLRVRLERARDLLGDSRYGDIPIGDVASRCGFAEASHFARRFRHSFGASPTQFRRHCLLRQQNA